MSEIVERYRKVSDQFTDRVRAVPAPAWDNPSPCEGWVARDVVRHLVEWVPAFFRSYASVELPPGPSPDDDPAGAWDVLRLGIEAVLADPHTSTIEFDSPGGHHTLETAIDQFVTGDVLVHTWALARATGLDETLDPDEVHRIVEGMEPHDAALRASGHFGPRVEVPSDADEQTRMLAFMGRRP